MIVGLEEAQQLILQAIRQLTGSRPWVVWAAMGAVRDTTVLQHQLFDEAILALAGQRQVQMIAHPARWRVDWITDYNAVVWQGRRVHLVRLTQRKA